MSAKKPALKKGKRRAKESAKSTSNADPDPEVNQNPVSIHFKNSGERSNLDIAIHPQKATKGGGLAASKHSQRLDSVAEKDDGLTVGDMALRVAVSPTQKEQEERQRPSKWLADSREVLTAVKGVPGGITSAAGAGAVIGPLVGILRLIEVSGFPFFPGIPSESFSL
jgi:hypothetical protein